MRIKIIILYFVLVLVPMLAWGAAVGNAPIAGGSGTTASDGSNNFFGWITFVYGLALSATAILAVLMLVVAGVEMMTAVEKWRTDAKQRIWNAFIGLFLAALSYVILKTIDPRLTEFTIRLQGIPATNSNLKQSVQQTHFELIDGACRAVLGPGPNECSLKDTDTKDFTNGYCKQGSTCLPMSKNVCESVRGTFSVSLDTCKTGTEVGGFCFANGLCLQRNADQCASLNGSFSTNKNDVCK